MFIMCLSVMVLCISIFCVLVFFFSSRRRHTRCALVTGVQTCALPIFRLRLRRIAREDEAEADAALLAERRMMELVRLHEPLRIAASRHPAEIALMDEPVVHQRIDDAVEEDAEPDPRPRHHL